MKETNKKKLKICYHFPSLETINAYRTIYNGYKNAFQDLEYEFVTYTANDNLKEFLEKERPDIFFTASHFYYRKFIDYRILSEYRKKGMKVFVKIDFWNSPIEKGRINEAKSLKDDITAVNMIKEGLLGDYFYHVVEQNDERMEGFEKVTGYKYFTIPLAADKIILKNAFDKRFKADISYIGTYLPQKRKYMKKYLFPLKEKYDLKLYGQDWSLFDRMLGSIQKVGQYFNIPLIKSIRKPKLKLEDEAKIYSSSAISVNIHEEYQREYGGDCNERTFKIPLCGGFEITDNVSCIKKYFKEDEIVIANSSKDWFEKIDYFIKNPDKKIQYIKKGMNRVLTDHTYHNRVKEIIKIYEQE